MAFLKEGCILALLILSCSGDHDQDSRLKKEVEDFQEFLRQRIASEQGAHDQFEMEDPAMGEDSEEYPVDDGEPGAPDFDIVMGELARHDSDSRKKYIPETYEEEESPSDKDILNLPESSAERRYPVEEILFVRRSNSESDDPIVDVVDKIIHDRPQKDQAVDLHQVVPETDELVSIQSVKESPSEGECPKESFTSNVHQTCPEGPEYEMRIPKTFSETLKEDMEKMMQGQPENKCDYRKPLGPSAAVEDRALCPFTFNVSKRNSSRIPEYLYEAKCSCQVPRFSKRKGNKYESKCVEMKRVIPVLWIESCTDGKRKYRQGWEKISVACVPLEVRKSKLLKIKSLE